VNTAGEEIVALTARGRNPLWVASLPLILGVLDAPRRAI
jgi:hypothetical protein